MKILLIILLIITVLVLGLLAYKNTTNTMPEITLGDSEKSDEKKDKKDKKNKKKDEKEELSTSSFKVLEIYTLPEILSEVSDISHVKDNLFACVQDELGTIFIYNADNNKIEREIPFAGKGDYEGIAWAGTTAYVINSSGVIYEVPDIENSKPSVKEYKTYLNTEDDVEAL